MSEYFPNHESFPHWVITDVRFPNELEAIRAKGGIVIRVNRKFFTHTLEDGSKVTVERGFLTGHEDELIGKESPTETALDDYQDWDYVIDNNDTLERLEEKVRQILIQEKIIL